MNNRKKASGEKGNKVNNTGRIGGNAIELCNVLHREGKVYDALQMDERTFSQLLREVVKEKPFVLLQKYNFEVEDLMTVKGKTFVERIIALWKEQSREKVSIKEFLSTLVLLRHFAYDCKPCGTTVEEVAVNMLSKENAVKAINITTKECEMPGCITHQSARKY